MRSILRGRTRSAVPKLFPLVVLVSGLAIGLAACGDAGGDDLEGGPRITSFFADEETVTAGSGTRIRWAVTGATRVVLDDDSGRTLVDGAELEGAVGTGPLDATTTFTLRAEAEGATPAEQRLTVTVTPGGPTITAFGADPAAIEPGGVSTLTWEVLGADDVTITEDGGAVLVDGGPLSGSVEVTPLATTTYRLVAASASGATAEATATVDVDAAPRILAFDANPNPIEQGEPTFLSWEVANAESLRIFAGSDIIVEPSELVGTAQVRPDVTTTYLLVASRPGETDASANVTVTVNFDGAPTIASFVADPASIDLGDRAELTWEVSGAVDLTVGVEGETPIVEGADATGALEVRPAATTTYELIATNPEGTNRATVTITVAPSAPLIERFEVVDDIVGTGEDLDIRWTTLGADTVALELDGVEIATAGDGDGQHVEAAMPGANEFVLVATNATGESRSTLVATGQDLPIIEAFDVIPRAIVDTEAVEIRWSVRGTVELDLLVGGTPVSGFPNLSGPSAAVTDSDGTFADTIGTTTTYVLRAATAAGPVEESITVNQRQPFTATPGSPQTYANETLYPGRPGRFPITASSAVYLEAATFTSLMPDGCTEDTELALVDGTGGLLGSDDDDGLNLCSFIARDDDFARLDSGSYELQVTEKTGTATISYALVLEAIAADVCGNGVVETGETCDDGNTASNDGCSSACESENFDANPGATLTRTNLSVPTGGSSVTTITVTSTVYLEAETFSNSTTEACTGIDTVMTLKDDQGNELGEDDDGGTSLCSKFDVPDDTFAKLGPGTYDLEITEFSGGSISSFDLVLEAYEADVCGNEIVEPGEGELCDDGNTLNGDNCTSQCQPDRTFAANTGTSTTFSAVSIGVGELVPVGITVTSTVRLQVETFEDSVAGTCPNIDTEASFRNDDYVEVAYDDDGGVDLCSLLDPAVDTDLVLFPGDYVVEIYDNGRDDAITVDIVLDALAPSCGDGIRLGAEQCDDGNTTAGDGCDASCDFEISGTFSATAMNSVTFTGESIAVGAIRVYEIDVPSGPAQAVEVETFSDAAAGTCTGIDTVVRLYDDAGAELGDDDDDGLSLCSLIDASDAFSTLQTGTYYLSVEEYLKNSAITYDIVFDVP